MGREGGGGMKKWSDGGRWQQRDPRPREQQLIEKNK